MNEGTQRLPGSEKLTRPEEIKALGKYLKKLREAYDENTNLDTTLVGTPGKDTGLLVDIEKLPTGKEQKPGQLPRGSAADAGLRHAPGRLRSRGGRRRARRSGRICGGLLYARD